MDPFLLYLLAINVAALAAYAVDYLLCQRFPALDDAPANSLILDVFPIAGGAAGTLLALFFLAGRGREHRINKDNIAWWFLAIICLVVWGLVVAVRYGAVSLDAALAGILTGWNPNALKALGIYLVVINLATSALFAWDKHVAATGNSPKRRVPEAYLLTLCLLGGSPGGLLAMHAVRHKTKKWYFTWGLPAFIVLDVALVAFAHAAGLL